MVENIRGDQRESRSEECKENLSSWDCSNPVNCEFYMECFACTLHRGKGRHWWEEENSRLERLADWRTTALPGQPELGTSDAVDGAGEL